MGQSLWKIAKRK